MATTFIFANNVNTTLSVAVSSTTQTTITLSSATNLPAISAGQTLAITLTDAATNSVFEVMYATAVSGSVLTVIRGQEGTAAATWLVGDIVYAANTAGILRNLAQLTNGGTALDTSSTSQTKIGALTASEFTAGTGGFNAGGGPYQSLVDDGSGTHGWNFITPSTSTGAFRFFKYDGTTLTQLFGITPAGQAYGTSAAFGTNAYAPAAGDIGASVQFALGPNTAIGALFTTAGANLMNISGNAAPVAITLNGSLSIDGGLVPALLTAAGASTGGTPRIISGSVSGSIAASGSTVTVNVALSGQAVFSSVSNANVYVALGGMTSPTLTTAAGTAGLMVSAALTSTSNLEVVFATSNGSTVSTSYAVTATYMLVGF